VAQSVDKSVGRVVILSTGTEVIRKAGTPRGSQRPREQQVLELLVKGYSYKDVSKELGISTSTVGAYVQRIHEKLHVSSRREIMERSGKNG